MSEEAREAQPFHALIRDVESLRVEVLHRLRTPRPARTKPRSACANGWRPAARPRPRCTRTSKMNGISVGLVFRLRQLRERIVRIRRLCWTAC